MYYTDEEEFEDPRTTGVPVPILTSFIITRDQADHHAQPTVNQGLNLGYETDEEEFSDKKVEPVVYETDEEEFEDPRTTCVPVPILTSFIITRDQADHHAQPTERGEWVLRRRKVSAKRMKNQYNLAYFTLWWNRMEREAKRASKDKAVEVVRAKNKMRLQSMLDCGERRTASEMDGSNYSMNVVEESPPQRYMEEKCQY